MKKYEICKKCVSYKWCEEKDILLDNCKSFLDKKSILKSENINIKKCPFCGREAVMTRKIEEGTVEYQVRCSSAHCVAKTEHYATIHQAELEWNTRNAPILSLKHWK